MSPSAMLCSWFTKLKSRKVSTSHSAKTNKFPFSQPQNFIRAIISPGFPTLHFLSSTQENPKENTACKICTPHQTNQVQAPTGRYHQFLHHPSQDHPCSNYSPGTLRTNPVEVGAVTATDRSNGEEEEQKDSEVFFRCCPFFWLEGKENTKTLKVKHQK